MCTRLHSIAGIILPDEQDTMTLTETDTSTVPEIPNESSDSDETAPIALPDSETVLSRHTKRVHFADVEPDSEPNLLDMVPPSPTQSRAAWAYSNVQRTVSVDTILHSPQWNPLFQPPHSLIIYNGEGRPLSHIRN